MKEILFKDRILRNKKKEISVNEVVENDGIVALSERFSRYTLRRRIPITSEDQLQHWIEKNVANQKPKLKRLKITKSHNTQLGEDFYSYTAFGNFFILTKEEVLSFIFVEKFKIRFIDLYKAREQNPY